MKQNERTLQMMKNFMRHHEAGLSIPEIAAIYDLSARTVYDHLGEIAMEAGVPRESLLEAPHTKPHFPLRSFKPVKPVDMEGFRQHFDATITEIEAVQGEIKKAIKAHEKIAKIVLKEEEEWNLVV